MLSSRIFLILIFLITSTYFLSSCSSVQDLGVRTNQGEENVCSHLVLNSVASHGLWLIDQGKPEIQVKIVHSVSDWNKDSAFIPNESLNAADISVRQSTDGFVAFKLKEVQVDTEIGTETAIGEMTSDAVVAMLKLGIPLEVNLSGTRGVQDFKISKGVLKRLDQGFAESCL